MALDYLRAYSFLFLVVDFGDVRLEARYLAGSGRRWSGAGSAALFLWTARGRPVGTLIVAWPAHGQRTRVNAALRAQSAG